MTDTKELLESIKKVVYLLSQVDGYTSRRIAESSAANKTLDKVLKDLEAAKANLKEQQEKASSLVNSANGVSQEIIRKANEIKTQASEELKKSVISRQKADADAVASEKIREELQAELNGLKEQRERIRAALV